MKVFHVLIVLPQVSVLSISENMDNSNKSKQVLRLFWNNLKRGCAFRLLCFKWCRERVCNALFLLDFIDWLFVNLFFHNPR